MIELPPSVEISAELTHSHLGQACHPPPLRKKMTNTAKSAQDILRVDMVVGEWRGENVEIKII